MKKRLIWYIVISLCILSSVFGGVILSGRFYNTEQVAQTTVWSSGFDPLLKFPSTTTDTNVIKKDCLNDANRLLNIKKEEYESIHNTTVTAELLSLEILYIVPQDEYFLVKYTANYRFNISEPRYEYIKSEDYNDLDGLKYDFESQQWNK